jgi:hypothetical protein
MKKYKISEYCGGYMIKDNYVMAETVEKLKKHMIMMSFYMKNGI